MRRWLGGFTLIELMVTVAVLAVLLTLAVPSFNDFRQRAAIRGAADQVASFWGDARFEAVRRNSLVKVGFVTNAMGDICLGSSTTNDPDDDVACDCFSSTACNVSRYPSSQAEWQRLRLAGMPDLGSSDDDDYQGVAVIDPKRGNITQANDAGGMVFQSPAGGSVYQLRMVVTRSGRLVTCEPDDAPAKLPQYTDRKCGS